MFSVPLSEKSGGGSITPAAYVVPVVGSLIIILVTVTIGLLVLIRTRKRKRNRAHLSQLNSPAPTTHEAAFYKKNGEFSPVSLLSPPSASAAYNDPLEFPRNRLYVYTKKVLGEWEIVHIIEHVYIHKLEKMHTMKLEKGEKYVVYMYVYNHVHV